MVIETMLLDKIKKKRKKGPKTDNEIFKEMHYSVYYECKLLRDVFIW